MKDLLRIFVKDIIRKNRTSNFNNADINKFLEDDRNLPVGKLPEEGTKEIYNNLFSNKNKVSDNLYKIIINDPQFQELIDSNVISIREEGIGGALISMRTPGWVKDDIKEISSFFDIKSTFYYEYPSLRMIVLPGEAEKRQSPKFYRKELQSKIYIAHNSKENILDEIKKEYKKNILKLKIDLPGNSVLPHNDILSIIYQDMILSRKKYSGNIEEILSLGINKNIKNIDKIQLGILLKNIKDKHLIDYQKFVSLLDPSINPEYLSKGVSILKRFED